MRMPNKPSAKTVAKSVKATAKSVGKSAQTEENPAKKGAKIETSDKPIAGNPAKTLGKSKKNTVKTSVKTKSSVINAQPDIETRLEQASLGATEKAALEARVRGVCARLSAKKADGIKIIHVEKITSLADYFIICSGKNLQQTKAIYDNLTEKCGEIGVNLRRSEGEKEGRWIAVDFGEIIVHIFNSEAREFYQLDKLWSNGTNVYEYTD